MIHWLRIRAALCWTLSGYAVAGLATAPLAAAPMPSYPVSCEKITEDPAWLVWVFRDAVWLSLAFSLPVATLIAAALVWRPAMSAKGAAGVGLVVGLILAAVSVGYSIAAATCGYDMQQIDP
ncbi:hypothetical protein [Micromonospora sp. HK10]|uniref:hypothetical protein n=1 Tax=Micromonospora sp. HK10 TaxID=1538294 RepID=UPI0012E116A3|nr:hypothetical protein [Micromonospora sp. HK10]